jgi:hypothetical protein
MTMTAASRLLVWVVIVALLITAYVVVIGGVVCIRDDDYTFAEYVADLGAIYRLLATAVVGAIAHGWLEQQNRKGEVDAK